ncbi:MAG: hypothetical protein AB1331_08480 [Bacillota bacterium]
MLRPWILALAVALSLAVGVGCRTRPAQVATIPFGQGDQAVYDLLHDGTKIGTVIVETAQDETTGDWTLSYCDSFGRRATVVARDRTLEPIGSTTEWLENGVRLRSEASYGNGQVSISTDGPDGTRTAVIALLPHTYDNEQLLITARAFPLARGFRGRFGLVLTSAAITGQGSLRVVGEETVSAMGDQIPCYVVEFRLAGGRQRAWYQMAAPHHLVKYANGSTGLTLARVGQ